MAEAMETDLVNEDDLGQDRDVFPDGVIGVPQGSALSTLAGNLLLFDFDQKMNGRGIVCIRYVDDFIILGQSQKRVNTAFAAANELLSKSNLRAYNPQEHSEKASTGEVTSGFDFLGCKLTPGLIQPTKANRTKVIMETRRKFADGKIQLLTVSNEPEMLGDRYAQIIDKMDHYLEGWANHFSFCNGDQVFIAIDETIDTLFREFNAYFDQRVSKHIPTIKRHLSGLRSVRLTVINRQKRRCEASSV